MKSIVISVLMLSMSLIFVSCENESQLTQSASDVETKILDKKPIRSDQITFTGDLVGDEEVFGCCPNAGPFPEYRMTLSDEIFPTGIHGTYDGNIFMNRFGRRLPWNYKVSFWWTEIGSPDPTLIVVRGGETEWNKKSGLLKVTFAQDTCWIYYPNGVEDTIYVDFVLTRQKIITR